MWAACCEWDLDFPENWLSPRQNWDDFNRLGWIFYYTRYAGDGFRFTLIDQEPF